MKGFGRLTVSVMVTTLTALLIGYAHQRSDITADENLLERHVKISLDSVTTTEVFTWTLRDAVVPGGIEIVTQCDEPVRHWLKPEGASLRDILQSIVSADPQYRWEINDGVINMIAQKEQPSLLVVRLAKFETTKPMTIDAALERLLQMPEVKRKAAELNLGPRLLRGSLGYFDPSGNTDTDKHHKKFSVRCENVTVGEILNALVRKHGQAMWVYTQGQCKDGNWFEINFLNR